MRKHWVGQLGLHWHRSMQVGIGRRVIVSRGIATGEVEIGATVHRIENTIGQWKQGVEERLHFLSESLADLSVPSPNSALPTQTN